jgi:AhpD family alkylhydroperoxidase
MGTTQETVASIQQNMGEMSKEAPEFMKAFMGFMKSAEDESQLDIKTIELILISLAVSNQCSYCIELHIAKGLKVGLTRAEILDAAKLAVVMGGGPALMYTLEVVRKALSDLGA